MTRWARSKSVLKHERQPGEATTWSEFVAQRQQAAKPSSVRHDGSKGSLRVLNTEERQPKTSNLAVKSKPASIGNFVAELSTDHGGAAGDVFDSKKTTTVSSSKPSRVTRSGSNLKAKNKNPTKRKELEMHDEEAEALEKLLLKHKKIEADIPVAQKAMGLASKKLHTVAPVPSSSTANGRDSIGSTLTRKTATKRLVSLKKKACLPKTNISASETAAPASTNTLPTSAVTKKCSAEKESPSSAEVSKVRKRKVISKKPPPPSFRENIPLPAQDEANVASSSTKKLGKVRKRKAQGGKAEAMVVNEKVLPVDKDEYMSNSDGEEGQPASKVPRTGSRTDGGNNKAKRLQWMRQEREAKGLLLLPEKVERRIYLAKKAMRKKGLPGEQIKEAVRKMRRKEELLFRRQLAKLCFKCRQPGHRVSDCPQMLEDSSEPIGICFKCGSTEHFSSACTVQTSKDNEFPYAKCFICKQQGHLSRKCPRNDKGVYPKGGHCNFCGAIDHFKKECPEMEKNKSKTSDESEVAADIVSIGQSADAENIVPLYKGIQVKKEKVISF